MKTRKISKQNTSPADDPASGTSKASGKSKTGGIVFKNTKGETFKYSDDMVEKLVERNKEALEILKDR